MKQTTTTRRVTIMDVARETGLSKSTVSYALNGHQSIPEYTRTLVQEAALGLGYRRNQLARAMVTGENRAFGFLTPHSGLNAEFVGRVLSGVFDEANRQSHIIKVFYIQDTLSEAIELSLEYRLAGLITLSLSAEINDQLREQMAVHGVSVVVIGDVPHPGGGVQVISDDEHGLRLVLDHLIELGHTEIAFLSGQAGTSVADWRRQTFARLMKEAGLELPSRWNLAGHWWDVDINEWVVRDLLGSDHRPTALVTAGDMAGVVAQRTARRMGLSVPDDLSVTGYGDYTLALFGDPPLTSVAQPFEAMGNAAVQFLLDDDTAPIVTLPTSLMVRESTAPPTHLRNTLKSKSLL